MTIVFLKGCIVLYIVLYLSISIALLTAGAFQKRSRPQQLTLCRSQHDEALQATASEGLAQGPYVAVRAGFEAAIIRSKGIDSINASPRPKSGNFIWACGQSSPRRLIVPLTVYSQCTHYS